MHLALRSERQCLPAKIRTMSIRERCPVRGGDFLALSQDWARLPCWRTVRQGHNPPTSPFASTSITISHHPASSLKSAVEERGRCP